ncbi:type IV secretion protein Rhs [Amycolatopsis bullii]|uniref:Type IV secretion protein Rhs n=2 Tax=Pseudonocardiaceae TaxID=2070 RepID=A0ABQ3KJU8_9PSEU|nr:type IV secretion protein Rhs [Amycolatopsis bullii]
MVSTTGIANAAAGPSVPLPSTNSANVAKQTMTPRAPDEASAHALSGNQGTGSTTPDGGGTSKATSLSPSATWDVSEQTGDFTWSYPLRVPPASGGLTPDLALGYNSSEIDGRTSATNNQASWIGDGWELNPGFIERTYGSCVDDKEGGTTPPQVGDLCWKSDNATASYNGSGGPLIHDTAKNVWRQKSDNGARIEHLTGAGNGAHDGEAWKITTLDGTQYFFGVTSGANSTWTVPVYGDDAGEPCHAADGKFENSSCVQGYRWNLDKVVDRHGNMILYTYDVETGTYGQNVKNSPVSYVRGGTLKEVQYGLRDGDSAPASGKVVFETGDRCVPGSSLCTFDHPENWPDVPLGERCGADCKDHYSPTFWSTKRLAKITTKVRRGTDYADVDSWTLQQTFPDPGDGEKAALWLKSITHTGLVGTPITLPAVTFEGKKLANRADKGDASDGVGPLNRYRLSAIVSESGGVTTVNYAAPDCGPGALPDKPETNTKRCYPATWAKRNYAERTDYFNKYVVASVVQSDRIGSSTEQVTNYEYPDGAAWHFSTSEFTPEDKKTWDDFRGFGRVIVRTGKPDDLTGPTSYAESRYYRGMNGDKLPNAGTRAVTLSDSEGGTHADEDWLRGFSFESITKNGENGPVVSKSITDPSWTGPTATRGPFNAYLVHTGTERTFTALAAGGWRTTKVTSEYDQYGLPTKVNDLGDINAADDDRCTTTTYAQNTALWLMQFASRVETTAVNCDQTPQYPRDTISDTRTSYDTRSDGTPQPNGTPPTKGDITLAEEIDHYDGAVPQYRTVATTAYDVHGRATAVTDADGNTTKSTYTPATGGPVTQLELTNALNQKTTRVYEPAWGTPMTVTGLNNWVTETTYDALGRTTEVWAPNRLRSDNPQGSARFTYDIRNDRPSAVSTTRVGPNGNFTTSTTILDSLYRTRQVQTPAPGGGRLLADTRYDSHGRAFKTTQPFYNDQPVDTDLWVASDTEIPGLTTTEFDGAERPVAAIYKTGANERWRTTTTYGGDWISVTPPGGGTPTTTITDARGHTRNLRQYHGAEPTGDYDETTYTYTAAGQLAGVTDSSGNHWAYGYDLHGLPIRADDPDRGTTTYTYDKLNQLATSTDARSVTLAYSYDHLGRKTGLYEGSTTGLKLAEWAYDTAYKGVGQLASSTRWVNGNAYVKKINAYSPLDKPTILTTTVPASEGTQLAGSYTSYLNYASDGTTLGSVGTPKAGDLPRESLLYVHDDLGNATSTSGGINNGTEEYVTTSDYTKYGELQRLQLGVTGNRAWLSSYYDTNTRRLDRTIVDAEVAHPMQADTHYTYNPVGAITSIADTPLDQPADTQCFRYDYLQRLTEAWTPASAPCSTDPATGGLGGPARYWQSFTYDKSGNRTTDTQHSAAGDVTRRYTYAAPGTPKPHILSSVASSGPAGTTQYAYDQVGNTKSRPGATAQQTLDWDTESRLATVTEGSSQTSFLYDADGGRLIRRDPTGTTLYLGDQEVRVDKQSGAATTTRYYSHGGAVVAVRTGGKLSWLAGDHQGTTQIAINTTDLSVQQRRQTPFGNLRGTNGELPGERGFVGGTIDQATGLTHVGARDYDADLGRFVSLDPILNPLDPQQVNGYSYANNSPVSFSDPSGLILQMDGRPAWIGTAAISAMNPANAERARTYNAGVKRNWGSSKSQNASSGWKQVGTARAYKNGTVAIDLGSDGKFLNGLLLPSKGVDLWKLSEWIDAGTPLVNRMARRADDYPYSDIDTVAAIESYCATNKGACSEEFHDSVQLVPTHMEMGIGGALSKMFRAIFRSGAASSGEGVTAKVLNLGRLNEMRDAGILKHGDVVPRPGSNVARASDETLLKIARDPNVDELIRVNSNADGTLTIIQGNQRIGELLNRAGQGRIGFGEEIPVWGRWGG